MRIVQIIVVAGVLVLVAGGIWRHLPAQREKSRVRAQVRAAELGAKLSFAENVYKEKFGVYTRDFSRLVTALGEELPCPLQENNTVLTCPDYRYYVQGPWLMAYQQTDPAVYITFGLESGQIDCSHAPSALQQSPLCYVLE
ncbi:MAG: hypothetical protein MJ053_05030 [Elusimicrobiaceae bacterium]|nr:hypothetical protein [Elusimicrobiaceae bacterium]